jgi:phosphoribosylaminoimidazole-succinocarboxamide synthase
MDKELIYEGKAKKLYKIKGKEDLLLQEFKDDATAFNALKKNSIRNKGSLNNQISTAVFLYLKANGIPVHFVEKISDTEMFILPAKMFLIEVVCRNISAGSLVKRYGIEEGSRLRFPVVEYYYKSDALGDPLFTEDHIYAMDLADENDLKIIRELTLKINELLKNYFIEKNILLVDFKLEFGKDSKGNIMLADEISPDTCRLWDKETGRKLDKDNFRFDLGDLEKAYTEVRDRIIN